jgi:hypothetical protein
MWFRQLLAPRKLAHQQWSTVLTVGLVKRRSEDNITQGPTALPRAVPSSSPSSGPLRHLAPGQVPVKRRKYVSQCCSSLSLSAGPVNLPVATSTLPSGEPVILSVVASTLPSGEPSVSPLMVPVPVGRLAPVSALLALSSSGPVPCLALSAPARGQPCPSALQC